MHFLIVFALVAHVASSTSSPSAMPSASPTIGPTSCSNDVRGFELAAVGNSGKVDLYPLCKGRKESIRINVESVTEVDSAGKATKNTIQTFANTGSWTKKREDYVDENGKSYPASSFTFSAKQVSIANRSPQAEKIDFTLKVWLFFQRSTLQISNTSCGSENCTMTVDKNAIKYDVEFSSWPFIDAANKLEMVVSTMEKGSNKKGSNRAAKSKGITETTFGGYMVIKSPSRYFTGPANNEVECQTAGGCVTVGNPTDRKSGTDSLVDMKYTFDGWDKTKRMRYDPAVDQPAGGGSTSAACRYRVAFAGVLACLWCFVLC